MDVVVTRATSDHIDGVKTLYDQVISRDKGTEYDVLWRRDLHPSDASLEAACQQGDAFLALVDGEIAAAGIFNSEFANGYELIEWESQVAWENARCLHLFCVHPDFRGKGVGKVLLREAEPLLREEGVRAIRLDAFASNVSARGLYEACGYVYRGPGRMEYEDQDVAHLEFAMYERLI